VFSQWKVYIIYYIGKIDFFLNFDYFEWIVEAYLIFNLQLFKSLPILQSKNRISTYIRQGVPEYRPAGHDHHGGQLFVVGESGIYCQGATLRETRQHGLGGRHFGRSDLLVDDVMQLVHGPHDARLVFCFVLVQRRQVKPRSRQETFVQRKWNFLPAGQRLV